MICEWGAGPDLPGGGYGGVNPALQGKSGALMNHLYYGDNLAVLCDSIKGASVDLIYLDPPFNSNANQASLPATSGTTFDCEWLA